MIIKEHFNLLGQRVKDKVSDYEGIVISLSFDLYGCIQADVRPMDLDKDGLLKNGLWLDVSRLKVLTKKPLMDAPNFEWGETSKGKKGPANLQPKI